MHTEKHACVPRVGQICSRASVLPVRRLAFFADPVCCAAVNGSMWKVHKGLWGRIWDVTVSYCGGHHKYSVLE